MAEYTWGGEGADNDAFSYLVDEWIEKNVEGQPSWGEMAEADAWAEEQMELRKGLR